MTTYGIRNFKSGPGMENDSCRFTLLADGKPVGIVSDWGTGGGYFYDDVPAAVLDDLDRIGAASFAEWCKESGLDNSGAGHHRDVAIGDILNKYEAEKHAAKQLRAAGKQCVFILDGDDPVLSYRTFPQRVPMAAALNELRSPRYAGKHPRVLNAKTAKWEAV